MSPRDPLDDVPGLNGTAAAPGTIAAADGAAEPAGAAAAVVAELEATPSMCHHCFDVLLHALRSPTGHQQHQNQQNGSPSSMGWGSNGNSSNTSLSALLAEAQQSVAAAASSSSDTATTAAKPDFVHHLPHDATECPLFVTWDKRKPSHRHNHNSLAHSRTSTANTTTPDQQQQQHFELRGCIGTLSPKPLITSIGEYALISALRDRRFSPVSLPELPHLRVGVSLLVRYEPCDHCHDWTVGVHGIIIRWSSDDHRKTEYSATYLPEVASDQGWDQKAAVESLVRKAGYHGRITKALLGQVQCTRYQSSKQLVTFEDYARERGHDEGLIALAITEAAAAAAVAASSPGHHGNKGFGHRASSSGCTIS